MNNSSPLAVQERIFHGVSLTTTEFQYEITMGALRQSRSNDVKVRGALGLRISLVFH